MKTGCEEVTWAPRTTILMLFLLSGAAALAQSASGNLAARDLSASMPVPVKVSLRNVLRVTPAAPREWAAKAKVQQLGLEATVRVTAFHGKGCHGYITDITEGSFEVTDAKTLRIRRFQFSSVERIAGRPLPDPSTPIGNRILRDVFRTTSRFGLGP